MEILEEKVVAIKSILARAAKNRGVVRYPAIYNLFAEDENKNVVWETFEQACREITSPSEAIYGVLVRTKGTELPQNGFFELFKNIRSEKYKEITGSYGTPSSLINREKQSEIVKIESETVYMHAVRNL